MLALFFTGAFFKQRGELHIYLTKLELISICSAAFSLSYI